MMPDVDRGRKCTWVVLVTLFSWAFNFFVDSGCLGQVVRVGGYSLTG